LLCDRNCPLTAVIVFEEMAKKDVSSVVQLYLAAALQRLPEAVRWPIAGALLDHEKVAADANLPLMIWYGVEPMVPEESHYSILRASDAKSPLVRRFLARRIMEHMILKKNRVDLERWAATLASAKPESLEQILQGTLDGLRGQKSLPMPTFWPKVYASTPP
jgi:hypothetical protein